MKVELTCRDAVMGLSVVKWVPYGAWKTVAELCVHIIMLELVYLSWSFQFANDCLTSLTALKLTR